MGEGRCLARDVTLARHRPRRPTEQFGAAVEIALERKVTKCDTFLTAYYFVLLAHPWASIQLGLLYTGVPCPINQDRVASINSLDKHLA